MIKFEKTEVVGWEAAIRGMRNPMNSWAKSDSEMGCELNGLCNSCTFKPDYCGYTPQYVIGPNDLDLMKRLVKAGTDHRKFMRMIVVYVDITAPLYWWKEFDTYKVGTVANSCSTMHKIADKYFTKEDFSCEHLSNDILVETTDGTKWTSVFTLDMLITMLNLLRDKYLETKDKEYWDQMIQLLPSSYNQKRTVMMSYEVLANIYSGRYSHKLDEWRESSGPIEDLKYGMSFCDWIKTLPHHELITGDFN